MENENEIAVDVQQFITNQTQMNENIARFMEKYNQDKTERDEQQQDTLKLLKALTEASAAPPTKKRRTDPDSEAILDSEERETEPDEAILDSTSGKRKASTSAEAILGSTNQSNDVLELNAEGDGSLIDDELALIKALADPNSDKENVPEFLEDEPEELDRNNMTDEQVEAYLCKEYSDWLAQTEEKVGPPVPQALGVLCERLWGKIILSQDKKKVMHEGVDIPSNCKAFKAPKLNPAIAIRVAETSKKKDDGAKNRQVNMSRTAIPLLYTLGELDVVKSQLEGEAKFLTHEPRNLDEAKKILAVVKKKTDIALKSTATAKAKVSKSFQLLNYYNTEATRKRRQDVCESLGSAFKPHALEVVPPSEYLFNEDIMKKMKKELNAIKPKSVEASKNGLSSTKSRRCSGQGQGKNYPKTHSSGSSGNYSGNNNSHGQAGGSSNAPKKTYPQRRGRGGKH